jgi:deoxycytidine triphosphate deaminase
MNEDYYAQGGAVVAWIPPATGVYSNSQIFEAVNKGHIVCHPFIEKNVAGSSMDVTLGNWYYRTERTSQGGFYNPFDEADVQRYFDGPHSAEKHEDWAMRNGRKLFTGIPADHPIIVLAPGERILGHTHEFVGIKPPGTSTMQARSTWGRNGVAVCLDAGWGDPGYINRWTMEIYNMNSRDSVVLPVGERIAQMVFYATGEVTDEYSGLSGKYQSSGANDLTAIMDAWRPEQMLPRAFKDQRTKPLPF